MTRTQAVAFALEECAVVKTSAPTEPANAPLTAQASANVFKRRELEVLRLVAKGLSNREIAAQLVLAQSTVKWYLSELYGKMGVANRRQAEIRAREMGLLD